MKDSAVFIGNLDPSSVVALGAPALVEAKSRELIALFGDTCRFILNSGCSIPAAAPAANIRVYGARRPIVVSELPRAASRDRGTNPPAAVWAATIRSGFAYDRAHTAAPWPRGLIRNTGVAVVLVSGNHEWATGARPRARRLVAALQCL